MRMSSLSSVCCTSLARARTDCKEARSSIFTTTLPFPLLFLTSSAALVALPMSLQARITLAPEKLRFINGCCLDCIITPVLSSPMWIYHPFQIKSNHFYCHITTAHVPWWVKFLRACSRQCRNNLHIDSTYLQTYTEDNVQNTHTHTQYTQCTIRHTYSYQYTWYTVCTNSTLWTRI